MRPLPIEPRTTPENKVENLNFNLDFIKILERVVF